MREVIRFIHDEQGQDLVEYTLLVAFIVFTTGLLAHGLGISVAGITTTTNNQLAAANQLVR